MPSALQSIDLYTKPIINVSSICTVQPGHVYRSIHERSQLILEQSTPCWLCYIYASTMIFFSFSAYIINLYPYLLLLLLFLFLWLLDRRGCPGGERWPHLDDLLVVDAHPLGWHAGLEEALYSAPHVRDAFPDVHPVPDRVLQAAQLVVPVEHRRQLNQLLLELTQLRLLVRLRQPYPHRHWELLCILHQG